MLSIARLSLLGVVTLLLSACGGGSGDSGVADTQNTSPPQANVKTGVLIDSPIHNVHFITTSGQQGKTNSRGEYQYIEGDRIQFSIGNIVFPEITCREVLTPLDIFSVSVTTAPEVINFIRLIQSLDDDGVIEEDIFLSDSVNEFISNSGLSLEDFSLAPEQFEALAEIQSILDASGRTTDGLVSIAEALRHLRYTLDNSSLIDSDSDGIYNLLDNDDDGDGVPDQDDAMPFNPDESTDFDLDNIGDNQDDDDDNDGIPDTSDTTLRIISDLPATVPAQTDVIYDAQRSLFYTSHKAEKLLNIIDMNTGEVEATIPFTHMPERMTIAPDGSKLYVALLVQEHSSYWWEEDQSGYIAIIDLELQAHTNTLSINTDPYDLVVTSTGKLIVASGSGQWTDIYAYDSATGAVLGKAGIRQASRLSLHPSENWVFAANTDTSPSDIEKFDISGAGITSLGDSPYHGDYRMSGNVWATPDGNYVITRGGDVFLASDMTYVASLTATSVFIEDLSFNVTNDTIIVSGSDDDVYTYALSTRALVSIDNSIANPVFIVESDTSAFALSRNAGIEALIGL